MVLVGQLSCQMKDVKALALVYSKFGKLPDSIKKIGPYFQVDGKEGVRSLTLYIFDQKNYEEVHDHLMERYSPMSGVSTVSYSIERWEDLKDALALLGVSSS